MTIYVDVLRHNILIVGIMYVKIALTHAVGAEGHENVLVVCQPILYIVSVLAHALLLWLILEPSVWH